TVYYISSSGNDLNTGTSPSDPWQTIARANTALASALPGDQFLFNKGDTFYGTVILSKSGALGNEIVIGSYGSGDLPIITGKKLITGWTHYSGNIYRAPVLDSIFHMYIGNQLVNIARYPNSGFLKVNSISGNTAVYSSSLNQSSGYWNGANIRLRTKNWCYETKIVSSFSGGVIVFNSGTQYTTAANYGFYLDNKLNMLDVQNEWFRDYAGGYVYLYAPGGVNPNSINVEGVVGRDGIYVDLGKQYFNIQNINFTGFGGMGIYAYTSHFVTITNCEFRQTTNNGIRINGTNHKINNNFFEDNLNNAIYGIITGGEIKNNNINRTGLFPGYGTNGRGYLGLNVHVAVNLKIENNIIDSTGYSAMSVGKNALIKNNFINYSLLKLNDGGGIDIADSDTMKITGNVILNSIGNTESSGNPALFGSGIYINAGSVKNTVIENNTSAFNTYCGIYIDHKGSPINNVITGNTCYNNLSIQILFADFSTSTNIPVYNTIVKNNILYSLSSSQYCMLQRTYTGNTYNDYGTFDSNYYCNPYSEYSIGKFKYPVYAENVYSLEGWQNSSGKDPNSKASLFTFNQFGITDTLSDNMIANSTFDTTITPWISWPSGASVSWSDNQALSSGSIKLKWTGVGNSIGLALSNRYSITTGSYYLVNLSSAGHNSGTFSVWGLSSLSSNTFSFPQTFFAYDTVRNDYSFTYKADITDPQAYMSIGLSLPDTVTYVDDLSMVKVNVEKIDSTKLSKLFFNEKSLPENQPLNGINYKDIDGNPVSGSIYLGPYSSKILINENYIPSRKLNLKVLIEGLYKNSMNIMISDTVKVEIRNPTSPFNLVDSKSVLLDSAGNGVFDFFNPFNSMEYYLCIKHRNALETWSALTVSFVNNILNYDFTMSAGQAFGSNQILIGNKYCIYSGDIDQNNEVELSDVISVFNSAGDFSTGYVKEDITGDGVVDLTDVNYTKNNASFFVSSLKP
ncbi:MAG TPA: right-handed parallel beta-helix repeat-containing protein, partial [Ignavibacteria bacterium]|nr:right-handed parallel beta-helix repeat-containing protein [Ignavibacteria bacterium]HMR41627.1 right-handed parallel beta-helix repeat-containing protein [Ignavibacteria bacterium]